MPLVPGYESDSEGRELVRRRGPAAQAARRVRRNRCRPRFRRPPAPGPRAPVTVGHLGRDL